MLRAEWDPSETTISAPVFRMPQERTNGRHLLGKVLFLVVAKTSTSNVFALRIGERTISGRKKR